MLTEISSIFGILVGVVSLFMSYVIFKSFKTMPQTIMETTVEPLISDLKETFAPTIKKAYGQLSAQGVDAREYKKFEKAVGADVRQYIMDQNPEIALALSALSGETMEMVEEHPEYILTILQKYRPLLEQVIPQIRGNGQGSQQIKYDL